MTDKKYTRRTNGFSVTSLSPLSDVQTEEILRITGMSSQLPNTILGGRGTVKKTFIPGIGQVVIKSYIRGGLARYVSKRTYVKWGKYRSLHELECLIRIKHLGIHVPDPIASVTKGDCLYRAWLITKEIPSRYSLAELSLKDEEEAVSYIDDIAEKLSILIRNNIDRKSVV